MSSALATLIAKEISQTGPIPVDTFMSLALYHPEYGYYRTQMPIGAEGDYITAPEMTQVFGECLGIWCVSAWQWQGEPASCHLVELGPGKGTLMADCLRVLRKVPALYEGLTVHMVDVHPLLKQCQQDILASHASKVHWHTTLPQLDEGPVFLVANEFFDALPIKQYYFDGSSWTERCVIFQEGRLSFTLVPCAPPPLAFVQPGYTEFSPVTHEWAEDIATLLNRTKGSFIFIDYGHEGPAVGETLQCLKAHQYHDPLTSIGESDLTHHVDFTVLKQVFQGANLTLEPLQPLSVFLSAYGFEERTLALCEKATPQQQAALLTAAARLVAPQHMGVLFKVLIGHTR